METRVLIHAPASQAMRSQFRGRAAIYERRHAVPMIWKELVPFLGALTLFLPAWIHAHYLRRQSSRKTTLGCGQPGIDRRPRHTIDNVELPLRDASTPRNSGSSKKPGGFRRALEPHYPPLSLKQPPSSQRWSALPRSSSGFARQSGRGRPASSGGDPRDSPCSRS